MTPEQYQHATRLFLEACELDGGDRAAFLELRCAADAELRDTVEKMLEQDQRALPMAAPHSPAASVWSHMACETGTGAPDVADAGPVHMPEQIGAYRLIEVIGEGGMGVVYLAEQENPRRTVAIKLIKPGVLSPRVLRRFEHETQILGRLQHPGIAAIFEAGTAETDQGRQPFFAMEHVNGRTLMDYATAERLGVRERLALIARTCDAVQHAHQKGIIHRDLKPANILVIDETLSSSDGTRSPGTTDTARRESAIGQPKILDFGVARVTDSDVQLTTLQTDAGQIIGTIPYMSPEQVGGNANDLDTRSDVYALGVLCYELLTGRLPYDVRQKFIAEAARIIREEEPERLSSVNKAYRGDIDTILAKALEKDRRRRYQSASEFAGDIRRYLNDEPIIARPSGGLYQLGKFARRNKALVTGVAVAFIALAWGLVHVTIERNRAVRAEKRAVNAEAQSRTEAENARLEAQKSNRIVEFLQSMLAVADPDMGLARSGISVTEAIDLAIEKIESELGHEPEVEAAVRNTIGRTLSSLAEYDKAERQLSLALQLRRSAHGPRHPAVGETLSDLGVLKKRRGHYDEALKMHTEALDIMRQAYGDEHWEVGQAMNNLGADYLRLGRHDEAEPLFREALRLGRKDVGDNSAMVARCASNLGTVLTYQRKFEEAEALFRQSLTIFAALYGDPNSQGIKILNNLAFVLSEGGNRLGAIEMTRKARDSIEKFYGDDHPLMATTVNNLAVMLRKEGNLEEAEAMYREVIALRSKTLGPEHPNVCLAMNNLGYLMSVTGRFAEAESLLAESLRIQRKALPKPNIEHINTIRKLADVLMAREDLEAAEPLLREALSIAESLLESPHRGTANIRSRLGRCLIGLGKDGEGQQALRKALGTFQALDITQGEAEHCAAALAGNGVD